jgi:hypothetical protein
MAQGSLSVEGIFIVYETMLLAVIIHVSFLLFPRRVKYHTTVVYKATRLDLG